MTASELATKPCRGLSLSRCCHQMKRETRGRKTRLGRALTKRICALLAKGSTIESAAILCNIGERTFHDWQERGRKTERGKFEKEHPDLVEQCKREAVPVGFPTGGNFNLTVQSRIARTPKLAALAAGMRRHEQQAIQQARAAAQEARSKAEAELKKLEAATK